MTSSVEYALKLATKAASGGIVSQKLLAGLKKRDPAMYKFDLEIEERVEEEYRYQQMERIRREQEDMEALRKRHEEEMGKVKAMRLQR
jgi:hypothetical protein